MTDTNPPRRGVERDLIAANLSGLAVAFVYRPNAPSPFEFRVEREAIRLTGSENGAYVGVGASANAALRALAQAVIEDDFV